MTQTRGGWLPLISSLPWTMLIDYVKVTQGANVIVEDQFNESPEAAPAPTSPKRKKGKST